MISVPYGTGDILLGNDICCADGIRFAYKGADIMITKQVYHAAVAA